MNYNEYKSRMEAQGRKPVEPEHYDLVETAYMALANADKDEFCQLTDRMIADIRILANQRDSARHDAEVAEKERRETWVKLNETRDALGIAKANVALLEKELRRHKTLVDDLAMVLPPEKLRDFLLSAVSPE